MNRWNDPLISERNCVGCGIHLDRHQLAAKEKRGSFGPRFGRLRRTWRFAELALQPLPLALRKGISFALAAKRRDGCAHSPSGSDPKNVTPGAAIADVLN